MRLVLCTACCLLVWVSIVKDVSGTLWSAVDIRYWRCILKRHKICPDNDIAFHMHTPSHPDQQTIDVRHRQTLLETGWDPGKKNVIIIHGFNGTDVKTPMSFIRDAFLHRGDYNVFTVDWEPLTRFPCYLSALANTKLVAQCTAQLYSHLTKSGALASMTTCVGHSLGAHICGMMSNHLSEPQYKIVGLDPARPLVNQYGSRSFRLTRDDAHIVQKGHYIMRTGNVTLATNLYNPGKQVIHTNAAFLGEVDQVGHADFCINGGNTQPGCSGHKFRRARCSHFHSACYYAASVSRRIRPVGVPCESTCPKRRGQWGLQAGRRSVIMGEETPESARGMYCVKIDDGEDCPFD